MYISNRIYAGVIFFSVVYMEQIVPGDPGVRRGQSQRDPARAAGAGDGSCVARVFGGAKTRVNYTRYPETFAYGGRTIENKLGFLVKVTRLVI